MLSDFDTWHKCPFHSEGAEGAHEDDPRDFSPGHLAKVARDAYKKFYLRAKACDTGLNPERFKRLCLTYVTSEYTPKEWVGAAEEVCAYHEAHAREVYAISKGFSCALEMELEAEYQMEQAGCW
jgi:hypothetical protein